MANENASDNETNHMEGETFLSPEQFFWKMEAVARERGKGNAAALTYDKLRALVGRVVIDGTFPGNVPSSVLTLLTAQQKNAGDGFEGLTGARIWSMLRMSMVNLPLKAVEDAIEQLLENEEIYAIRDQMTFYKPGQPLTEERAFIETN